MSAITLTREQLYDRVWSTPLSQLAQEFGISDVAIAKTCRKMDVPTPPRGYWAKLAAGQNPKRKPLPRLPLVQERQGLAAAVARQQHAPSTDAESVAAPAKVERVSLPADNRGLHPVARELRATLLAANPNEEGMLMVRDRVDLPESTVSKKSVDALVRSFDVILVELEARGVEFRRFRGKYGHPAFHCGAHQISLTVEELIETIKREPTEKEKRRPSWEWQLTSRQPSGRFQFSLGGGDYYNRSRTEKVIQKSGVALEETVAQVIEKIWDTFVSQEKAKLESEEKWRRQQEEDRIREQEASKAKHHETLAKIANDRAENLVRAAQWWSLRNITSEFVDHCERQWRSAGSALTRDQEDWLAWARGLLKAIAAIEGDYPDPAKDGRFDPAAVPFGGPYPTARVIPRPPTMPAPPAPPSEVHHHHSYSDPKPYPFWIKYQR